MGRDTSLKAEKMPSEGSPQQYEPESAPADFTVPAGAELWTR
jgi:hypothetical protein